ncbi:hypothetical protein SGPA1_21435 [Streptomyces misionensis JCM 4497]
MADERAARGDRAVLRGGQPAAREEGPGADRGPVHVAACRVRAPLRGTAAPLRGLDAGRLRGLRRAGGAVAARVR